MLLGGGLVLVVQGVAGWTATWLVLVLLALLAMPWLQGFHSILPPRRQEKNGRISLRAIGPGRS